MAQMQRDNDGVIEYAYMAVKVKMSEIMSVRWDKDSALDKSIINFKGALNEIQLLAVPDDAKSVDHLALQIAVVGQDADGNDMHEYSLAADNAAYDAMKMEEIRQERDKLLRESDFSQLVDAPFSVSYQSDFATYRQALRDLPANITDVDNVNWPAKP